jgi:hypothetical protein
MKLAAILPNTSSMPFTLLPEGCRMIQKGSVERNSTNSKPGVPSTTLRIETPKSQSSFTLGSSL